MPAIIVVGAQWGDEGKGKITDLLSKNANHVIRPQGGSNAGHTLVLNGEEYKLHQIPSGILHPKVYCYLGAGTVIDPAILIQEIDSLETRGYRVKEKLFISDAAHVIFPYHKKIDRLIEKMKRERAIGTTGSGIGPCYADKSNRIGIRMGEFIRPELFFKALQSNLQQKNKELTGLYHSEEFAFESLLSEYTSYAKQITPFVTQVEHKLRTGLKHHENILLEGAQGTFLDLTTGTYPYVTSSNTNAAGLCSGAGIAPNHIDHIMGVVKAYTSRVGAGPFPTEVVDSSFIDHRQAREIGTTTGRQRRVGWFDAVLLKTAAAINGLQSIALTKLDVLDSFETVKICVGYQIDGKRSEFLPSLAEDCEKIIPIYETLPGWKSPTSHIRDFSALPENAKNYLRKIEEFSSIPLSLISVGPEREQTIILKDPFANKDERDELPIPA